MQILERYLLPEDGPPTSRKVFVLHGLGGMGKTRLAVEFAKRHQNVFDSVFFLNGKTLSTLAQSFARLLKQVTKAPHCSSTGANERTVKPKEIVERAKEWFCLEGNVKWLIIFDNVDMEASERKSGGYKVQEYFPSLSRGSVLITTRLAELAYLGDDQKITKMNPLQSAQLFFNTLGLSWKYHGQETLAETRSPETEGS